MAKVIETTKGFFLVVEKSELKFKEKRGILHVYHHNCLVDWIHRIKLSEMTEKQAGYIMFGKEESEEENSNGLIKGTYAPCLTCLYNLIRTNNIKINENTYIFEL